MLPELTELLGIIIILLSTVTRVVVNIVISSTTPCFPDTSTNSPIFIGLNISKRTPAAKFEREPCRDIATANDAAPIIATNDAV